MNHTGPILMGKTFNFSRNKNAQYNLMADKEEIIVVFSYVIFLIASIGIGIVTDVLFLETPYISLFLTFLALCLIINLYLFHKRH